MPRGFQKQKEKIAEDLFDFICPWILKHIPSEYVHSLCDKRETNLSWNDRDQKHQEKLERRNVKIRKLNSVIFRNGR